MEDGLWETDFDETHLSFKGLGLVGAKYHDEPVTVPHESDWFDGPDGEKHQITHQDSTPTPFVKREKKTTAVFIDGRCVKELFPTDTGSGFLYFVS